MTELSARLHQRLAELSERIDAAARRAGRTGGDVRLVGVTKYVDVDWVRALVAAGCRILGESRPQELWRKADELADLDIEWHLIGSLQRNKLERTLPLTSLVHSGDRWSLLESLDAWGQRRGRPVPVLLEINVSGEASKHGFQPDELPPLGSALARLSGLDVRGLMGMASRDGDQDVARREFRALRLLRDRLAKEWPEELANLRELSMGMSGDYETAVEEGATLIRLGSILSEGLG